MLGAMLAAEAPNLVYVLVLPGLIMAVCGALSLGTYVAVGWMSKHGGRGGGKSTAAG